MLTQISEEIETKTRPALLFVDDERRVLTSMRAMFRREFDVLLADSGDEALTILREREVHVVISDQRMPEMTGVEFLSMVRTQYPNSMRILLTGYADLEAVEASINESEVFRYLMKPCPTEELKDAVRLAVHAAEVQDVASFIELEAMMSNDVERIELTSVTAGKTSTGARFDVADAARISREVASDLEHRVLRSAPDANVNDRAIAPVPYSAPEGVPSFVANAINDAQQQTTRTLIAEELPDPHILVLTDDTELMQTVEQAMGDQCTVLQADSVPIALSMLSERPVGVLITDLAVSETDISQLTRTLKQEVPQLVTIIASECTDAVLLIGLINHGQIYRFLLKPLQVGQTRIWLKSAVAKYKELCVDASAVLRHQVSRSAEVEAVNSGLFSNVRATITRMKKRIAASMQTGLTGFRSE